MRNIYTEKMLQEYAKEVVSCIRDAPEPCDPPGLHDRGIEEIAEALSDKFPDQGLTGRVISFLVKRGVVRRGECENDRTVGIDETESFTYTAGSPRAGESAKTVPLSEVKNWSEFCYDQWFVVQIHKFSPLITFLGGGLMGANVTKLLWYFLGI
jgi:hypothetical protein